MTFVIKQVPDGTPLDKERVNLEYKFAGSSGEIITIGVSGKDIGTRDNVRSGIASGKLISELMNAIRDLVNIMNQVPVVYVVGSDDKPLPGGFTMCRYEYKDEEDTKDE